MGGLRKRQPQDLRAGSSGRSSRRTRGAELAFGVQKSLTERLQLAGTQVLAHARKEGLFLLARVVLDGFDEVLDVHVDVVGIGIRVDLGNQVFSFLVFFERFLDDAPELVIAREGRVKDRLLDLHMGLELSFDLLKDRDPFGDIVGRADSLEEISDFVVVVPEDGRRVVGRVHAPVKVQTTCRGESRAGMDAAHPPWAVSSHEPKRAAFFRFLGILLCVALGLYAVTLVAANLILRSQVFARIADLGPDFRIYWKSGYSLWPGRVFLRDLTIEGQDNNVIWRTEIERVRAQIDLFALPAKRLHTDWIRADGATFKLVYRDDALRAKLGAADEAWMKEFKPAELRAHKIARMWAHARSRWQVELEDVIVERLPSLKIQKIEMRGTERLSGRLFLWPGVEAEIGPGKLEATQGVFLLAGKPLLDPVSFSGGATFGRFYPEFEGGSKSMKRFSLDLRASSPGLRLASFESELRKLFPQLRIDSANTQAGYLVVTARHLARDPGKTEFNLRMGVPQLAGMWRERSFSARTDLEVRMSQGDSQGLDFRWVSRDWNGSFKILNARFGVEKEFFVDPIRKLSLEGAFTHSMTDASPLIDFLGKDAIPLWAAKALQNGEVKAHGLVFVRRGVPGLYAIDAQAGAVGIQGRVSSDHGSRLIFKSGLLAVGVELQDKAKPRFRLYPGSNWLDLSYPVQSAGQKGE